MSSITVDEVEAVERNKTLHLISSIFHLTFADLCADPIYAERKRQCYGCRINHPSQRQHDCLMMPEDESWNLFYEEAKTQVDSNQIWYRALDVSRMLNFPLHNSWKTYLSELYKMPWTTLFLLRLQMIQYDGELNTNEKVFKVLGDERNLLKNREVSIPCPVEFFRKNEEPMEIDFELISGSTKIKTLTGDIITSQESSGSF